MGAIATTFRERLEEFARSIGTYPSTMLSEIGMSTGYYSNAKSLTPKVERLLGKRYPQLNLNWLRTGQGKMLRSIGESTPEETELLTIPLIPVSLQGGSLLGFSESVNDYECEKIVSPVNEAEIAATVTGDSMSPEYPNGSVVLLKRVNEKSFIEWGRTYALDTVNGPVIKNVFPCREDDSKITCRSINPNFADFNIPKEDIRAWYRVLMQMSLK